MVEKYYYEIMPTRSIYPVPGPSNLIKGFSNVRKSSTEEPGPQQTVTVTASCGYRPVTKVFDVFAAVTALWTLGAAFGPPGIEHNPKTRCIDWQTPLYVVGVVTLGD